MGGIPRMTTERRLALEDLQELNDLRARVVRVRELLGAHQSLCHDCANLETNRKWNRGLSEALALLDGVTK